MLLCGPMVAQEQVTIQQTPSAVREGSAQLSGPFDPQQMLRLVFALQPPHMAEEEAFLRQLQDPKSPQFHQYLSDQQWNERFAPSAQDEQAVVAWAQSQGFTITQRFSNRLLVDVEAPVAVIEKALNVSINSYQSGEKNYFSNDRDPSIPASLANVIHTVVGLNSFEAMHSSLSKKDPTSYPIYSPGSAYVAGERLQLNGNPQKQKERAAQKPDLKKPGEFFNYGAIEPTDLYLSTAYNYQPLNTLGHCCNPLNAPESSPKEASIAILIWGDYADSDLQSWVGNYGFAVNARRMMIDGAPYCTLPNCAPEPTLDVEYATAMANSFSNSSNTAAVYVYEASSGYLAPLLDALNHALNDGYARVLSMSWGGAEIYESPTGDMDSFHSVFDQMIGEGWTLAAASGDGGATTDCQHTSVSYPASDPDITAVGGTTIQFNDDYFGTESAWSGYQCSVNDGGTGGGCSVYFSAPWYQGVTACGAQARSVPDIALNAGDLQVLFYDGQWMDVGGTSISTPEMAGFFAQENAYLLYLGSLVGNTCGGNLNAPCAPIGAGNPYLYAEGNDQFAAHYPFYDITWGCNRNDITDQYGLTYYCAYGGLDWVTGWGSANMLQLAWTINSYLANDYGAPAVSFSGPAFNHWYNTDQPISWTLTDSSGNGHPPMGTVGFSISWNSDPGDPYYEPTPQEGTYYQNNYYGPQYYGTSGNTTLSTGPQGCDTFYVRGWDNGGNSWPSTYGPVCYDTDPPYTTVLLNGQYGGQFNGPVQVSLVAWDNASGVAATYIAIDYGAFAPYVQQIPVYAPGYHCGEGYSVDVAGNIEQTETTCFTILSNPQYTLSVLKSGTGNGTVTSSDGAINCGSTCSAVYYNGQPLTLTASPAQGSVFAGWQGCDSSVGFSCTVTVTSARNVAAIFNVPTALRFVPIAPCRVVDTRGPTGPFGGPSIYQGTSRDFAIPNGPCPGIPTNAAAYSLNVTAIPYGYLGYLTIWPTALTRPQISLLNSFDGRVKANAAIVPVGDDSSVSVFVDNTTDVLLDIDGYFIAPNNSTLAFFSVTPCRVIDTRNGTGDLNGPYLTGGQERDFPILESPCVPSGVTPQAYSFNVTVDPHQSGETLGYLTIWPQGGQQPTVSTLNNPTGTIVANAALVAAGTNGGVAVYPDQDTDLIVDINGYFAPASSGQHPLSLYTFAPCRLLDTRQAGGAFSGELTVAVATGPCDVPSAGAYTFNASVLPSGMLGYLTLWPDGQQLPQVSTLNAIDGAATSNMAIVPTTSGSIDAYASGMTQLILDISSYFAP